MPKLPALASIQKQSTRAKSTRRRVLGGAAALGIGGVLAAPGSGAAGAQASLPTRTFTDFTGREVEVSDVPRRVVTMQDQNALLPLWELGFRHVVGSVGAIDEDGNPYFRRMETHGFDTTGISFVGEYGEPDLEAVIALHPDLIVSNPNLEDIYGTLSQIAPTVQIDAFDAPIGEVMRRFGELVGFDEAATQLDVEYQARIGELQAQAGDPGEVVISVICTAASGGAAAGQFYIDGPGGSVEEVLRTVGFARPAEQLTADERTYFSVEEIRTQDADLLLNTTFRQNADQEETNTRALKESPLWAQLNAVRKGQAHDIDGEAAVGTGYSPRLRFIDLLSRLITDIDLSGDLSGVEVGTP